MPEVYFGESLNLTHWPLSLFAKGTEPKTTRDHVEALAHDIPRSLMRYCYGPSKYFASSCSQRHNRIVFERLRNYIVRSHDTYMPLRQG